MRKNVKAASVRRYLLIAACALATAVFPACAHRPASAISYKPRTDCNTDATVVRSHPQGLPDLLIRPGHPLEWVVVVAVKLDASGRVQRAAVWKSYGETTQNHTVVRLALNAEALKAANSATYRPKIVNCKAVPSVYMYQITFTGAP